MSLKICKDCEYIKYAAMDMGHGPQMLHICTNSECRDPVDGSAMPAHIARKELAFCGIQAKYFQLKEVKTPAVVSIIKP